MGYCTLDQIRTEEGLPLPPPAGDGPTDARVLAMIEVASALIDRWTNWWFEPRDQTYLLDGPGDSRSLYFPAPIVAITSVEKLDAQGNVTHTYDPGDYVVYNRHLQDNGPDDRRNSRIEYQQAGPLSLDGIVYKERFYGGGPTFMAWPRGQQNIKVVGRFGYTDPDPTGVDPEGVTPEAIRRLCRLLTLRVVWPAYSHGDLNEIMDRGRLTDEKTRDQSWKKAWPWTERLAGSTGIGMWTGDPEIDLLLMTYQRPMGIAAI